jgi:hypothetical protein
MKKINLIALGISFVAINANLLASQLQINDNLETVRYRFGTSGYDHEFPFQVEGFSGQELFHRWTDGNKVSFTIPPMFDNKRCKSLIFTDIGALLSKDHPQTVHVFMNNLPGRKFVFSERVPTHRIEIPLPYDLTRPNVISFQLPNACLPRVMEPTNIDPRKLALAMKTVDIVYEKPQQQIIDLCTDQTQPLVFSKGFSGAEQNHRWLDGEEAIMTIPHSSDRKLITQLTFHDVSALISDTHFQKVIISGEGIARQEYLFTPQNKLQNITINLPLNRNGDVALKFEMPNASCPSILDPSYIDPRKLSINLSTARVVFFIPPVKRALPQKPQAISQPTAATKPAVEKSSAQDKTKRLLLAAFDKIESIKQKLETDYRQPTPKRKEAATVLNALADEEVVKEQEWDLDETVNNTCKPVMRTQTVTLSNPKIQPGKLKIIDAAGNLMSKIKAQYKEYATPEPQCKAFSAAANPTNIKAQVADASVMSAFQNLLNRQRRLAAGADDEDTAESDFDE